MKKIIVTASIAFVIALSALIINPSVAAAQSPQANQALISSFNHISARTTDDWNGGLTTRTTDDWNGGLTTRTTDDWNGGLINLTSNNSWFF